MFVNIVEVLVFVFCAVVFAAGLAEALFPKWCWKTFESWKAVKVPSKAYFLRRRIEGVLGVALASAIMLGPALMAYFRQ
ncbi:DUF6199 family natural product biosynthesis protein [uncultured Oscillibacter sp.]|jgi:hypothetical protein|uniref:DUF6199 family natural product biosynthesis protein n=1 Tax=uncultured Oscillibacter sp. TaxID=876091 RepID=UPI0025DB8CDD|nr:DUF6199 family natural product biosynthesis protein [uncultured Oscillibacter sp.]